MGTDAVLDDRRRSIDARLETVCTSAAAAELPIVRDPVDAAPDRWYGQVALGVHEAVVPDPRPATEPALPAAVAIELLRAYCRLRSELLVQLTDEYAHSFTRDETGALLAADYLYSAAYEPIGSLDGPPLDACYEAMTTAAESVNEAFASIYCDPGRLDDRVFVIEQTAGALGEAAAKLGAIVGGSTADDREGFAALGRHAATARHLHRSLDARSGSGDLVVPPIDVGRRRTAASRRRSALRRRLEALSPTAETGALRALVLDHESIVE